MQADDPPIKVFIFAGQSNLPRRMKGQDLPAGLETWVNTSPENDCLHFFNAVPGGVSTDWEILRGQAVSKNLFGAQHVFAYYLTPYFKSIDPDQRLAFIHVQGAATSLATRWNAGGRVDRPTGTDPSTEKIMHSKLRTAVTQALDLLSRPVTDGGHGLSYEVVGLIWNQGEGDMMGDGGSKGYAVRFRDFIDDWEDDPAYPQEDRRLYTGSLRSGFMSPSNGVRGVAFPESFVLTTRTPLLQAETKPWGDKKYYQGPIGTLRVRDSLTEGNEADEDIQGIIKASSNVWWASCDEFSLHDSFHLGGSDRTKLSQKYAGMYMSDILGLGCDAVDFWPSMLTSEGFDRAGKDPYTNSPTYRKIIPYLFGSAAVANAHTRRYPAQNEHGYPLNTQAMKAWWTGTDQRWSKTNPTDVNAEHAAVFNGSAPGRLAQVICDSHSIRKALKISFDVKSIDRDDSPNGLTVSLYGATTEGRIDNADASQPAGQYLPADFTVALADKGKNRNVECLARLTVLDSTSGTSNELEDWTSVTLTANMINPEGYSYFTLVFEGKNVQTDAGDFLGVDNVMMVPAERAQ